MVGLLWIVGMNLTADEAEDVGPLVVNSLLMDSGSSLPTLGPRRARSVFSATREFATPPSGTRLERERTMESPMSDPT